METQLRSQTSKEELINAATHGAGLVLAFIAIPFLFLKADAGNAKLMFALGTFSFGIIAVYSSSTFYHVVNHPILKKRANIADHISILFLIGGTYTPIVLIYTTPQLSLVFLSTQWSIIALGTILKIFFTGRYDNLSLILYILLGWMLIFIINPVLLLMPDDIFYLVIAGGISYSAGTIFFRLDHRLHAHNIWHCFVLGGTVFHYIAIYKSL